MDRTTAVVVLLGTLFVCITAAFLGALWIVSKNVKEHNKDDREDAL